MVFFVFDVEEIFEGVKVCEVVKRLIFFFIFLGDESEVYFFVYNVWEMEKGFKVEEVVMWMKLFFVKGDFIFFD